jgi:hypothetical protein
VAFRSIQVVRHGPGHGEARTERPARAGMRYRARYKDAAGKEVIRAFADKEKSKA